jgi:hypothetical protein
MLFSDWEGWCNNILLYILEVENLQLILQLYQLKNKNSCNFTSACRCRWDGVGWYKDRTGIMWEQTEGGELVHG